MQFTIGTITRCAGNNHWLIPVTVGAQTVTLSTSVAEMQAAGPETVAEGRVRVLERLRSVLLEAGATTFAAARTALEGKSYEI